uniref:Uncharacterized protein n=1 Tax=Oryza glaberrima TaxID=4538 RepID=I1P029_ORYGL
MKEIRISSAEWSINKKVIAFPRIKDAKKEERDNWKRKYSDLMMKKSLGIIHIGIIILKKKMIKNEKKMLF